MGAGISSPFGPEGDGEGVVLRLATASSRCVSPMSFSRGHSGSPSCDITEEFVEVSQYTAPEEHCEETSPSRAPLREEDLDEPPREPREEPPRDEASCEDAPREEPREPREEPRPPLPTLHRSFGPVRPSLPRW